jgi:hypothetical protein
MPRYRRMIHAGIRSFRFMKGDEDISRHSARLLYWSPRFLGIAFALFLSVFALDVFDEARGFWQTMLALSIHLIPSLIVLGALIAGLRWAWAGAASFASMAAVYMWWSLPGHASWAATIAGPLLVIAALFLANWMERAKVRAALSA